MISNQLTRNRNAPPRGVLFLDIDGVMNSPESMTANRSKAVFLPGAVAALRAIMARTGCRVVISSSWRGDQLENLRDALAAHGLGGVVRAIIGTTPVLHPSDHPTREDEIGCWLHRERYEGRLAILDDEPSLGELSPWHVAIRDTEGLVPSSADKAVLLLLRGRPFTS